MCKKNLFGKRGFLFKVSVLVFLLFPSFTQAQENEIARYLSEHPEAVLRVLQENPITALRIVQQGSEKLRTRNYLLAFKQSKGKGEAPRVNLDSRLTVGNAKAPTTILMFTDFTCSFCSKAAQSIARVLPQIADRSRLVFKSASHGGELNEAAFRAVYAATSVDRQKAFTYALTLFAKQNELFEKGEPYLDTLAEQMGLGKPEEFHVLRNDAKFDALVKEDMEESRRFRVDGTPTFYFNEIRVDGALPDALYINAVDIVEGKDVPVPDEK